MFTIIVVSYNPGDKLRSTLESIYAQTYGDYRIIIKDGGSTDSSLVPLGDGGVGTFLCQPRTRVEISPDKGIYDAMNQAVAIAAAEAKESATKDYYIFMNCGDSFYDNQVLEKVANYIESEDAYEDAPVIYYGDQYNELTKTQVSSAPSINEFALFRNVPCHQTCFYDARLFNPREDGSTPYNTEYRVRADYEHFLHSIYKRNAKAIHMPITISNYEGGGFSETPENRRKSAKEHREITTKYMGKNATKYRWILKLSGSDLRTYLAESPRWSKSYNKLKSIIYNSVKR